MKLTCPKGREIELDDVHGQHDDDIQYTAFYVDNGEEVADDVIDYIYDTYFDVIYDEWYQNKIGEAEYHADLMEDR